MLGINAIFHDPAAALVVDGRWSPPPRRSGSAGASTASGRCPSPPGSCRSWRRLVSERGRAAPGATWTPSPTPRPGAGQRRRGHRLTDPWDRLRAHVRARAPQFLADGAARPGPGAVRFVPHHVAHAASAGLAAPDAGARGAGAGRARRGGVAPRRRYARRALERAGRAAAAALARPALRGPHRAPRLPALQRRVQGDGAGLVRRAGSCRVPGAGPGRPATAASPPSRSTGPRWPSRARPGGEDDEAHADLAPASSAGSRR